MPNSGSPSRRRRALDQLDARPDAAGVLPAAAGAAEPFAEDRPGRDEPALGFLPAAPVSDAAWPVARMQTEISEPAGWSKPPAASPWGCR